MFKRNQTKSELYPSNSEHCTPPQTRTKCNEKYCTGYMIVMFQCKDKIDSQPGETVTAVLTSLACT